VNFRFSGLNPKRRLPPKVMMDDFFSICRKFLNFCLKSYIVTVGLNVLVCNCLYYCVTCFTFVVSRKRRFPPCHYLIVN